MAKAQFPNPKFWAYKDEMNWEDQKKNLIEVGGIFWDMLKATDWKAYGNGLLNDTLSDIERVKGEYADFMALSADEKIDRIKNGERSLGRLYRKGSMATSAVSGAVSRTPYMILPNGQKCGECSS